MVLLLECVKVRLHFEQVTVELKLLCTHVKMFAAELLPLFVGILLLLRYFMFLPGLITNELSVAIVLFKPDMVVDISVMLDWHDGTFLIFNSCFVAEFMVRTLKHMNIGHMRGGNIFVVNGLVPQRNRLAVVVVVGQFMMAVVLFHVLQFVFMVELVHFVG